MQPLLSTPDASQTAELRTLHNLLHLLFHRNRNQHRRSIWWRAFSSFRRELGRLLGETAQLELLVVPGKGVAERRECVQQRLESRLRFWQDVMVEKWYISFTHLTTSNQFAAIGLVLLASLARTSHILGVTAALQTQADEAERERLTRFAEHSADEIAAAVSIEDERRTGPEAIREDVGALVDREALIGSEAVEAMEKMVREQPRNLLVGGPVDENFDISDAEAGEMAREPSQPSTMPDRTLNEDDAVARKSRPKTRPKGASKPDVIAKRPVRVLQPRGSATGPGIKKAKKVNAIDALFSGL